MDATTRKHLLCVCETAIFIALAFVLNFAKLEFAWLQGGSISLSMIPILVLSLRRGAAWGIPAGLILGIIDCAMDGGFGWGIWSVLLDYLLAYAAVGTCGFFYKMRKAGPVVGTLVGCLLRFVVHFISGVTIYKIAVPTDVYGLTFSRRSWTGDLFAGVQRRLHAFQHRHCRHCHFHPAEGCGQAPCTAELTNVFTEHGRAPFGRRSCSFFHAKAYHPPRTAPAWPLCSARNRAVAIKKVFSGAPLHLPCAQADPLIRPGKDFQCFCRFAKPPRFIRQRPPIETVQKTRRNPILQLLLPCKIGFCRAKSYIMSAEGAI